MSICRNCFKKGDHSTHDFNMFLSQAGGACDCGDTSVMKADGFCSDHGIHNHKRSSMVPKDLMAIAEAIMPRLLLRLLFHFRDDGNIKACDSYCSMLMELNNIGELMRNVMTTTLLDKSVGVFAVSPLKINSSTLKHQIFYTNYNIQFSVSLSVFLIHAPTALCHAT